MTDSFVSFIVGMSTLAIVIALFSIESRLREIRDELRARKKEQG